MPDTRELVARLRKLADEVNVLSPKEVEALLAYMSGNRNHSQRDGLVIHLSGVTGLGQADPRYTEVPGTHKNRQPTQSSSQPARLIDGVAAFLLSLLLGWKRPPGNSFGALFFPARPLASVWQSLKSRNKDNYSDIYYFYDPGQDFCD